MTARARGGGTRASRYGSARACSTASTSRSPPARWSASSGRTAAARRRCVRLLAGVLAAARGRGAARRSAARERSARRELRARDRASCRRTRASTSRSPSLEVVLMGRAPHLPALGFAGRRATSRSRARAMARARRRRPRGAPLDQLSGGERQRVLPGARAGAGAARAPPRRADDAPRPAPPDRASTTLRARACRDARARRRCRCCTTSTSPRSYCDRLVLLAGGRVRRAAGPPGRGPRRATSLERAYGARRPRRPSRG